MVEKTRLVSRVTLYFHLHYRRERVPLEQSGVPRGWVLVGLARRASERKDRISVSGEEKGARGGKKSGGTLGAAWKQLKRRRSRRRRRRGGWLLRGKSTLSPFLLSVAYVFGCSGKHSWRKMRLIGALHVAVNPGCPLEKLLLRDNSP